MIKKTDSFSRRSFLKGTAAAGLGAIAAPALISSSALASSGELNYTGWAGYDFKVAFAAFTKETGIKMNFTEQPDNDTIFAQAKLAIQTGAIDVIEPTVDRVQSYSENGLVQAWDMNKIKLDQWEGGIEAIANLTCHVNLLYVLILPLQSRPARVTSSDQSS